MARRKDSSISDALLYQLLAGADPKTAFDPGGLLDGLKKALADRALNAEPPDAAPDPNADQLAPETAPMPEPARRDRNAEVDFRGERRSNATHASTTNPDARCFARAAGPPPASASWAITLMETFRPKRRRALPERSDRSSGGRWSRQ